MSFAQTVLSMLAPALPATGGKGAPQAWAEGGNTLESFNALMAGHFAAAMADANPEQAEAGQQAHGRKGGSNASEKDATDGAGEAPGLPQVNVAPQASVQALIAVATAKSVPSEAEAGAREVFAAADASAPPVEASAAPAADLELTQADGGLEPAKPKGGSTPQPLPANAYQQAEGPKTEAKVEPGVAAEPPAPDVPAPQAAEKPAPRAHAAETPSRTGVLPYPKPDRAPPPGLAVAAAVVRQLPGPKTSEAPEQEVAEPETAFDEAASPPETVTPGKAAVPADTAAAEPAPTPIPTAGAAPVSVAPPPTPAVAPAIAATPPDTVELAEAPVPAAAPAPAPTPEVLQTAAVREAAPIEPPKGLTRTRARADVEPAAKSKASEALLAAPGAPNPPAALAARPISPVLFPAEVTVDDAPLDVAQQPGPDTADVDLGTIDAPAGVQAGERPGAPASTALASTATVPALASAMVKKLDAKASRFELELDPAGLGKVKVQVHIDTQGRLAAQLNFERPDAAAALRGRADELRTALQAAGFDLGGASLSFNSGADHQAPNGQAFNFADSGSQRAAQAFARAVDAADEVDRPAPPPTRRVSSSALDLRI